MRKVMIIGAGEIGLFIAERLTSEKLAVTVMDENPDTLAAMSNSLDVAAVQGNGANIGDLERGGARGMNIFIAATNRDETNLITALLAHELGVPNKIVVARQMNAQQGGSRFDYRKFGIDLVVNINEAVRDEMLSVIETQGVSELAAFSDGQIILIGHQVDQKSNFLGKTVQEMTGSDSESFFYMATVVRNQEVLPPEPDLYLELEDYLYLFTTQELLPILKSLLNVETIKTRTAVIYGYDHLAQLLAASLSNRHFQITMLAGSEDKAARLREQFRHRRHFHVEAGQGTEVRMLRRVKVPSTSVFLATMSDDATNVMACMAAKYLGAAKTIATIKRNDILPLCHHAGVDVNVAPRLAAAKVIQKAVHEEHLLNYRAVSQTNLEVVEMIVGKRSKALKRPLGRLKLPKGVIVGGIVSGENPILPTPDYQIQAADRVIVLTLPELLVQVEQLFAA